MHPEAAAYWQRRWDGEEQRRLPMSRPRWEAPTRHRAARMQGETAKGPRAPRKPGVRCNIDWQAHRAELWRGSLADAAEQFGVTIETIRRARRYWSQPTQARQMAGPGGCYIDWRNHRAELWAGSVSDVALTFGVLPKTIRDARRRHPRAAP
jgi:hypothetical protein